MPYGTKTYVYTGGEPRAAVPTPSQDAVVAFIERRLAAGKSPSLEDIRKHMGWMKVSSVRDCLRLINRRGRLPAGYEPDMRLERQIRGTRKRVLTAKGWEAA